MAGSLALFAILCKTRRGSFAGGFAVARWGSDEFVVVMPGVYDLATAIAMADGIRDELAKPFTTVIGETVVSTISVGIAIAAESVTDPEALLREADIALERAKALGKQDLLDGADEIARSLTYQDQIARFEAAARARRPWVPEVPMQFETSPG